MMLVSSYFDQLPITKFPVDWTAIRLVLTPLVPSVELLYPQNLELLI